MSKKHKNRNRQQNQNPGTAPVDQPDTGVEVGDEVEGEDDDDEVSDDEMMAALGGSAPAPEAEKPAAPAEETHATFPELSAKEPSTIPEEKPAAEAAPAPKVQVAVADKSVTVEAPAVDLEKTAVKPAVAAPAMSFGISPRKRQQMAVRAAATQVKQPSSKMHTATGMRLIKLFDDYEKMVATTPKTDVAGMKRAARKMYDIMCMVCPTTATANRGVYRELINIVFERMIAGYGTIYDDAKLLRVDYSLPTPVDSMKFDAFWTAMYQLVEWAKTGRRATFNSITLGRIIKSTEAMTVINDIRSNLASR